MKITIITVVYNGEKYIKETIESVIGQSYSDIEYILIDGKSTDQTLEIINHYKDKISCIVSEEDQSMYDAINKGLKLATGDYVQILNSDDYLANEFVISNIVKSIRDNPGFEVYYGNINKLIGALKVNRRTFQCSFEMLICSEHGTFIPHPALFVSRNIASSYKYNLEYKYASDFDYILFLIKKQRFKYLEVLVTTFREHSASITASGKLNFERLMILKKYDLYSISFVIRKLFFFIGWIRYKINTYVSV
jgi:glycosyltransferase involved in cell wall biosynthesis